ncbi:MAG TPA: hypothetical protein PKU80_09180 [Candidatus Limiplasma sp.]|nr:hypothetical protein [Candidatus Limiplasma sp.]HRX09730.1 hypothetical protein [Candidatus Limiplasma sp.]
MLYSQTDREQVTAMRKRRLLVVWIPTVLVLLLAIGSFIVYRLNHDQSGWVVTGLITILAGAYCIFFFGVYLRPVLKYKHHVDYMLDGRKRVTQGILKEIGETLQDREGIDCYMVMLNVGEKNDPEDDRLFYLDGFKALEGFQPGDRVTVETNDRMIASIAKS